MPIGCRLVVNILDKIAKCKKLNKKAALVPLDIKKAFDSLSHKFVVEILRYFNFGEQITNWRACISLTTDTLSKIFELESGNAQGDNISLYIFILYYQILLFRIEYNPAIRSIVDVPVHPTLPPGTQVNNYARKIFAYTDGANLLLKLEVSTFRSLVRALENYRLLSGLECNIEKP